ncbi:MAG: lipase family protein [Bacteroidota bacterium]
MKTITHMLTFVLLLSLFLAACKNNDEKPGNVKVYELSYQTPGVDGTMVNASGIVMVPPSGTGPFPLLSCQHGTIFYKEVAPSYLDSCQEAQAWLSEFAANGYVVVMADYIGLGKTAKTLHPYFHAQTEATAARDMIRAAKKFCEDNGILLNNKLFLAGYSQGGHVTSSLQRLLQANHSGEFSITASAIMAAPFDLSMLFRHHITNPNTISTAVTSLMVKTFNWIYTISPNYQDFFIKPYDSIVPALLDFNHNETEVINTLKVPPVNIFQPTFLADVNTGTHSFNKAMEKNEVYDWRPIVPTLLVFSMADEVVPYTIENKAYARWLELGGNVDSVNLGNVYNHSNGFIPALMKAKEWFDKYK